MLLTLGADNNTLLTFLNKHIFVGKRRFSFETTKILGSVATRSGASTKVRDDTFIVLWAAPRWVLIPSP